MTFIPPKTWAVGDVLSAVDMNTYVRDNTAALNTGFRFAGRRFYSPAGSYVFEKANPFGDGSFSGFPVRLLRVIAVGGGGAGGGANSTGSSQFSAASGGSSGHYAESTFTDIAALSASIEVIVGAGGTGVSAGVGGAGGESRFAFLVRAAGGNGGTRSVAASGVVASSRTLRPLTPHVGQIRISGEVGEGAVISAGTLVGGTGGSGVLGSGGGGLTETQGETFGDGLGFGAGGGGVSATVGSAAAQTGRPGADGVLIVEVYI
jgi:hypothetical protein